VTPKLVQASWWTEFNDPLLSALIAESLSGNYTLAQFLARMRQAEASIRGARALRYGELDYFGGASAGWEEDSGGNHLLDFGLRLSWEPDVWGRLCSIEQAERYGRQATVEDWRDLQLLLSGQVAEAYYQVIEQQRTLDLLGHQIEVSSQNLSLIELRFSQGIGNIVDVLQQREQLASVEAERPAAQSDLRVFQHRLAVLSGKPPSGASAPTAEDFPSYEAGFPAGFPSELLMLRPDLRAQANRLVAIDYRIGEAIADCYPRFTLSGVVGRRTSLDPSVWFANALSDAVGPILDSGRRQAEIDFRRGQFQEELAVFNQMYLEAIEEVENALWREQNLKELIATLERQREAGEKLLNETKIRYSNGLLPDTGYITVLDALRTLQEVERELIVRKRQLVSLRIALHLATGGPIVGVPTPLGGNL
jgi:multidrug efflux system outer membrane protein